MADQVLITTDDGSKGLKGVVTASLRQELESNRPDLVLAVGPAVMMKFVAETTRPFKVRTVVSLNPIMVDGTGMCGGCRVTVGGETRSDGYYDYNVYYSTGAGTTRWGDDTWFSSLSTWSANIGSGDGTEDSSNTSNPNFLNASGDFSLATDFKRSSYPTDGRGGSWPSVRGAYITGSETIGLLSGEGLFINRGLKVRGGVLR